MILCIEIPEDSTQKLLELINEFSKVAEYKVNIQKSVAFLHTSKKISERERFFKKSLIKSHAKNVLRNKAHQGDERLIC